MWQSHPLDCSPVAPTGLVANSCQLNHPLSEASYHHSHQDKQCPGRYPEKPQSSIRPQLYLQLLYAVPAWPWAKSLLGGRGGSSSTKLGKSGKIAEFYNHVIQPQRIFLIILRYRFAFSDPKQLVPSTLPLNFPKNLTTELHNPRGHSDSHLQGALLTHDLPRILFVYTFTNSLAKYRTGFSDKNFLVFTPFKSVL